VGDPRLVAEQPTAVTNWCCSCPIDTACHCFISSLVCLLACNGRRCCQPLGNINSQLTLCQVTADEIDAATKLLDKACQKLRDIPDVPPQRITDLETAIRQLRQLSFPCWSIFGFVFGGLLPLGRLFLGKRDKGQCDPANNQAS